MPDESSFPVAIVTGAGSGIGRATAVAMARRGWRIALAGRRAESLQHTAAAVDRETLIVPTDLADPAQTRRLIDDSLAHFHRLDGIVNNAGFAELVPIPDVVPQHIARTLAVNLLGPIHLIAAAWPHLFARPGGRGPARIVNVSSMSTIDPFPGLAVYAAAKSGLESLARSIRNEAPPDKLIAINIAPGAVETRMLRSIADEQSLPPHRTLAPETVAETIVAVLDGRHDNRNGDTIPLPSP